MALLTKTELNLLAGWQYLLDSRYRKELREEWLTEPAWVVAIQVIAGICSVAFPLIVVALLAYVGISRHLS